VYFWQSKRPSSPQRPGRGRDRGFFSRESEELILHQRTRLSPPLTSSSTAHSPVIATIRQSNSTARPLSHSPTDGNRRRPYSLTLTLAHDDQAVIYESITYTSTIGGTHAIYGEADHVPTCAYCLLSFPICQLGSHSITPSHCFLSLMTLTL